LALQAVWPYAVVSSCEIQLDGTLLREFNIFGKKSDVRRRADILKSAIYSKCEIKEMELQNAFARSIFAKYFTHDGNPDHQVRRSGLVAAALQ
jgi:hypothetical protein